MRTGRNAAFTGGMTNQSTLLYPLTNRHTVFGCDVQIHDVPSGLLRAIPIHIYNYNTVLGTNDQTWDHRQNPRLRYETSGLIVLRCKIYGRKRAFRPTRTGCPPGVVRTTGKRPCGTYLDWQRHRRLGKPGREEVPKCIGTRPWITKHILVKGREATVHIHDAKPLVQAVMLREQDHHGNSTCVEGWVKL